MRIKPRDKFLPFATAVFGKEERKEVIDTLNSGWITLGPRTKRFEENLAKYVGSNYAIATSSASAALHLSLVALGIKEGDEVITTPFTFAATANAILHCGGKPVFVDIDRRTFNIDSEKIESAITKRTKCLLPVHYAGQPVNLGKMKAIAKRHNLYIVEDAAHAIGTEYKGKKIGAHGDLVCFSFHPVKNITTGDGGAITTNNKKLAKKLAILRVNGMEKEAWKRASKAGTWDYDIVALGFKYHMNDIAAALGLHQLRKLDKFIRVRRMIADTYDEEFRDVGEVTVPYRIPKIRHAHNIYGILVNTDNLTISRNEIIEKLKGYNVGSLVYYRPLHLHPYYQKILGYKKGDFPNAEYVFERLICIPIWAGMTRKDAKYVARLIKEIIKKSRK